MKKYPDDVLRCWTYWEALRRCGFAADDIFTSVYFEPTLGFIVCGIQLRTQGKSFVINAARLTRPEQDFFKDWVAFCTDERPDADMQKVWDKRPADIGLLPAGLVAKGFVLPGKN